MLIAVKNLVSERSRFVTSLFGVGFAVVLILVMSGIYLGTLNQVTTYIDHTKGKVWVMQPGVDQMFRSVSWLDDNIEHKVDSVVSVKETSSFLGVPTSLAHNGTQTAYYLIGYDPAEPDPGPWELVEGRNIAGPGETVMDSVLAKKNDIHVGDQVKLVDGDFKVVGLSSQTAAVGNFYVFISLEEAAEQLRAQNRISFVLAEPADNFTSEQVAQDINEQLIEVDALPSEEFAKNSREIVASMVGRPLVAMIAIGILVGFALIAVSVLSLATEQMREFGILRAIGVTPRQLYFTVIVQSLILAAGGYVLGVGFTYLAQMLIQGQVGDVSIETPPQLILSMAFGTLLMAFFACLVPTHRVSNLDPATAFRR